MHVRIGLAGTAEAPLREAIEAETRRIEPLLVGQDDGRREPAREQRVGQRGEFDGFRPGADDQPNVGRTQPSP